jgi:DNA-binding transcriptional MerR regulator
MEAKLQTQKYLIGDVARIAGLTRDALRFYEKKGIITSEKMDNGYRCYSDLDIYRLMHIMYYRKMNISLSALEELMSGREEEPLCSTMESIAARIQEEREELRRHQQALTRLLMTQRDLARIERCQGKCSMEAFPEAWLLARCDDFQQGILQWFSLGADKEELDMTYFYNVLEYRDGKIENKGTELLFYKQLSENLDVGFPFEEYPCTSSRPCIYQVVQSDTVNPGEEIIREMVKWGQAQDFEPEGLIYVNVMSGFFKGKEPVFCLEIYVPVKGGHKQ